MSNIFALSLFFALLFSSPVAQAEDLKVLVGEICHAYLEHPQDFVGVKMEKCDVPPMPMAKYAAKAMKCFEHTDSSSQITYRYVQSPSLGTCSSTYISWIDEDNTAKEIPIQNSGVNGYLFGSGEKAVTYKNHLLFMKVSSSRFLPRSEDLRLVQGDRQTVLCDFKRQVKGWLPPEPRDNPLCQKFGNSEYTIESQLIDKQDWDKWPKYPEGRPLAKFTADLDGDGQREEILKYDYSSGAGCGMSATPLVILKNNEIVMRYGDGIHHKDDISPELEALAMALNDLSSYGDNMHRSWFVVTIDNKDYVTDDYEEYGKGTPLTFPRLERNDLSRSLYAYKNGNFEKVCQQKSDSKKIISHEVIPKEHWGKLNYQPLE